MYVPKSQKPLGVDKIRLDFNFRNFNHRDEESYTYRLPARIVANDQNGEEIVLGSMVLDIAEIYRMYEEEVNVRHKCDDQSFALDQMAKAWWMKDGRGVKDGMEEYLGEGGLDDICFIDEVRLEPEYRGHGIGLIAVDYLINNLPVPADTFVLAPHPLNRDWADEKTVEEHDRATNSLIKYWELLGFKIWPHTVDLVLMGLRKRAPRPSIEEVMGPKRTTVDNIHFDELPTKIAGLARMPIVAPPQGSKRKTEESVAQQVAAKKVKTFPLNLPIQERAAAEKAVLDELLWLADMYESRQRRLKGGAVAQTEAPATSAGGCNST